MVNQLRYSREELFSLKNVKTSTNTLLPDPLYHCLLDNGIARKPRGCRGGDSDRTKHARVVVSTRHRNAKQPLNNNGRFRATTLIRIPVTPAFVAREHCKFALMNTRSVRNKAQFVKDYIDDNNIDIVALTETWLSDGEVLTDLTNGGYNLVHLPRKNRRGGGVGLLFRSTFHLLSHKHMTTGTFECINVTLRCQRTKVNIQLLVVYRPPSSSLPRAFLEDFTELLNNVANHLSETIISGDFNIRYNNSQSTDVANFADLLDCAGFIQHVTEATHVSGNVLDLVITHRCSNIITSPVIPTTLLTDHLVVECELRYGKPGRQTHRVQYRKYSSIDQKTFTEDVRSMFTTNLEKHADCFAAYQDAVTDAVDMHAPTMTRVVTVRPKTPWHTQELSDAKRDLRRAESRWRKSKLVVHRDIFTSCRNDYRRHLIATKAEYYCTMVDEAGRNMKKLFDVTNTLLGRTTPTLFPNSTDGVPLADRFNTFFVDKISRIMCRIDARAEATTTEYQAPRLHGDETLYEFTDSTVADIKHIILHSTSKTCALDPVPTSILKDNAETFAPLIMKIVNASLQSGTVPADMKHALVTPLHKRHGLDTNNLANYRPVSNIGFVSKVLERYVANAMREHVDNNGYNDAFQSACHDFCWN